ncbi:MAG: autolysin [Lentisphaerae bacterium ADurb.BinA184]|nr:MAG: autolysin [Lentisphaerae bacterium ADurb.BinA184]
MSGRSEKKWMRFGAGLALAGGLLGVTEGCRSNPKPLLDSRDSIPAPYAQPQATAVYGRPAPGAFAPAARGVVPPMPRAPIETPDFAEADFGEPEVVQFAEPAPAAPAPKTARPAPAPAPKTAPAARPAALELPRAPESKLITYKVEKNDSLWEIGQMYGVSHEELATYNKLKPDAKLVVGKKLTIPPGGKYVPPDQRPKPKPRPKPVAAAAPVKTTAGTPAAKPARTYEAVPADGLYTIKEGDNPWLLARRFGVKTDDILALNGLQPNSVLQIGTRIKLPAAAATTAVATAPPPAPPATGTGTPAEPTAGTAEPGTPVPAPQDPLRDIGALDHTVVEGDTIDGIVGMYGTTAEKIKRANPLIKSDADLKPGTIIKVPYN